MPSSRLPAPLLTWAAARDVTSISLLMCATNRDPGAPQPRGCSGGCRNWPPTWPPHPTLSQGSGRGPDPALPLANPHASSSSLTSPLTSPLFYFCLFCPPPRHRGRGLRRRGPPPPPPPPPPRPPFRPDAGSDLGRAPAVGEQRPPAAPERAGCRRRTPAADPGPGPRPPSSLPAAAWALCRRRGFRAAAVREREEGHDPAGEHGADGGRDRRDR